LVDHGGNCTCTSAAALGLGRDFKDDVLFEPADTTEADLEYAVTDDGAFHGKKDVSACGEVGQVEGFVHGIDVEVVDVEFAIFRAGAGVAEIAGRGERLEPAE
jgi:hypothetical protein